MRFSSYAPAIAGLASVADATLFAGIDVNLGGGINLDGGLDLKLGAGVSPAKCDFGHSWENHALFRGKLGGDIDLDLSLPQAQCSGGITITPLDDFVKRPCLRVGLGGFKAYVEVQLSASGAVYQTVELVASPKAAINLGGMLDADLGAAFALDLLVGAGAAVDASAGFYVSFSDSDFLDLSIATKEIIQTKLEGMVVTGLPIAVGANVDLSAGIKLDLGLRLRSHVTLGAGLDLAGIDLGKGEGDVAIWADLCSYTVNLGKTDKCECNVDSDFGFGVGLGLNLGVSALDVLDLGFSPNLAIKLGGGVKGNTCMPNRGTFPSSAPLPSATGDLVTSTLTATNTYTVTSCAASVPNCPADKTSVIVTTAVESTVTVCPKDQTAVPTAGPSDKPVSSVEGSMTTMSPCQPTTSTVDSGGDSASSPTADFKNNAQEADKTSSSKASSSSDKSNGAGVVTAGLALAAVPLLAALMI